MSDYGRRNVEGMGRQVPGCLSRMVNLFDLTTSGGGNKMLTDKPHCDGSSLSRSRSAALLRPTPAVEDQRGDKVAGNRINGTPMKKLLAQEMSKEMDYKLSPTNVVAKLMGLDPLPQPQPHSTFSRRGNSKSRLRRSLSHEGITTRGWDHDSANGHQDLRRYKDVYEIWQQPESLSSSSRNRESLSMKMDIVREKFMEAKHMVTDEKLRHSKEFQDAMEVLSSNKELFLNFLQESNHFFSEHLHDFKSSAPETKRITILKPSKMADDDESAGQAKQTEESTKGNVNSEFGSPLFSQMVEEYPTVQSTRIVVLKPSPAAKGSFAKALASSCPTSPRGVSGSGYNEEMNEFEEVDSRDVARRVTKQMRKDLMKHQRDKTIQSPPFANGYIGDDSSFNRSDNDFMVENLSNSEIISPVSRHSWDYINRYDSPFSSSPFSRASCSPESSVCKEAKKRLSERWALMASNGNSHEPKAIQKSSSTLGEMLALSDIQKELKSEEAKNECDEQQGPRVSTSYLASNLTRGNEGIDDNSLKSLQRSKSVPESSMVYKTSPDLKAAVKVPEELTKSKSLKWSLKGRVSNFFSRNKKASKEKSSGSQSHTADPHCADDVCIEHRLSPLDPQSQSILSHEAELSIAKPAVIGFGSERADQPSPISVLETSFEDNDIILPESSILFNPASLGPKMSLKSNLIDKSPPIGSISRTLSWDDSRATTTASGCSAKGAVASPLQDTGDAEEEEEEWSVLVNKLLSAADLGDVLLSNNVLSKWHSMESPIDPSLRNKYANTDSSEIEQKLRSKRKLVFDLVNALLLELAKGYDEGSRKGERKKTVGEHVRTRMEEWAVGRGEVKWWEVDEDGDLSSLAVERAAREEAAGEEGGWPENKRREIGVVGEEVETILMEELVHETLLDLTQLSLLTLSG